MNNFVFYSTSHVQDMTYSIYTSDTGQRHWHSYLINLLHIIVIHTHVIIKFFLTGADVNYPNALTGSLPLHEAVEFIRDSKYSTFESMFHILRSYGAILNVQTCTGGDTPLFRAILLEKDKAAALLIRHGTDVNLCDVEACVVDNLRLARKRNNFHLAQMIVYAGFDLQHSTPDLKPPRKSNSLSLDSLRDWLTYMKFNPMRLTELCRLVIRAQLRERVYEKITSSYLPLSLKKYVLLEDLDFC